MSEETLKQLHKTIAGVNEDYAALRNNTAAAKLIEYTNHLTKEGVTARAAVEPLVLMVAPLAPHLAEELWRRLGNDKALAHGPFPVADPAYRERWGYGIATRFRLDGSQYRNDFPDLLTMWPERS